MVHRDDGEFDRWIGFGSSCELLRWGTGGGPAGIGAHKVGSDAGRFMDYDGARIDDASITG